jgi:hypothetical protein
VLNRVLRRSAPRLLTFGWGSGCVPSR